MNSEHVPGLSSRSRSATTSGSERGRFDRTAVPGPESSGGTRAGTNYGELGYVLSPLDPAQKVTSKEIRRIIIEQSFRARVGHIGSALSVADIIAALYGGVMKVSAHRVPERDRFVMSKGHAALALYAALHLRGWISQKELDCFCADDSLLGVHPEFQQTGVDFTTGSLGQGLSLGVGAALAAKWQNSSRRIFVLLSDAECNEGSVWEAIMVANHHKLSNLIAIVDMNGQQALGYTQQVTNLHPMDEKWRAFGWDTRVVDGHDAGEMTRTLEGLDTEQGRPHVLLANTVCGKGVSFMEKEIRWHYLPLTANQYDLAIQELGRDL